MARKITVYVYFSRQFIQEMRFKLSDHAKGLAKHHLKQKQLGSLLVTVWLKTYQSLSLWMNKITT